MNIEESSLQYTRQPYAFVNVKFWCHCCQREFSRMMQRNVPQEVFCNQCSAPAEEINPQNDPRRFRIFTEEEIRKQNSSTANNTSSIAPEDLRRMPSSPINSQTASGQRNERAQSTTTQARTQTEQSQGTSNNTNQQAQNQRPRIVLAPLIRTQTRITVPGGGVFVIESYDTLQPMPFGGLLGMGPTFGGIERLLDELMRQDNGPQSAPQEKINRLEQVRVSDKADLKEKDCPVCYEAFKAEEIVTKLPCNHHFHKGCVVTWLQQRNSCPVCRQAI